MRRILLATSAVGLLCAAAPIAVAGDPTGFAAGRAAVERARELKAGPGRARNVVLFVGDGMGVGTVTAARILEGQLRGESGEENLLAFETFPHVALVKTYNTNQQTPDSAGTMTAIVTGAKTRAGVLSVSRSVAHDDFASVPGNELRTIVERAEAHGLATGIVTTTTVTHATPAALYAHSPNRDWESDDRLSPAARAAGFPDIARQLIELSDGDGVDVVLGGGRQHFLPRDQRDPELPERTGLRLDGRDLTAEWRARGERAAYVWNRSQLLAIDATRVDHLLGLFAPSHLPFAADARRIATPVPSLGEMTAAALAILARDRDGFFLMVEGGRIDHGHHAGNAYRALTETIAFSDAVRVALSATDPDETLVLVTADHSHVFTIAGYPTRGNDILGKVVSNDAGGEPAKTLSRDARGRPYTTLGYQNGPGASGSITRRAGDPMHKTPDGQGARAETSGRPDLTDVDTSHPDFLQEAAIPFAYETHSGEDVAVYATGPGSQLIHGVQEQHYLFHAMVEALGWNRSGLLEKLRD